MADTTAPVERDTPEAGGGHPNAAIADGMGAQFPPSSNLAQPYHETLDTGLAVLQSLTADDEDRSELPVKWSGAPTREALKQLRLESRCPGFCAEQAWEVLTRLYGGETLTKICRDAGTPSRAVVMWWSELVPEFGVMLEKAQVSLGGVMRDRAAEILEAEDGDPARGRAVLALAGSYDRRIAKGDEGAVAVAGLTVNVSW
jgi:hypothetical protein